jgi:type I restriction enzyme R subunit
LSSTPSGGFRRSAGRRCRRWRRPSAPAGRSRLKLAIEDALDTGLPREYSPELYRQECSAMFERVYESYPEQNAGVYGIAI